jgi:aminomethyltransferase
MIPFGGWEMPVQYSAILDEHTTVRTAIGVFDISHMGQFFVTGPGALSYLETLLTNRVAALQEGDGQYSFLLNEQGGVIDDLILYRTGPERFLLIVNAAKIEEDEAWMRKHLPADGSVNFENQSAEYAGFAVQGPKAAEWFAAAFGLEESAAPARNRIATLWMAGTECLVARTGYTGEDGFEVFTSAGSAEAVWTAILTSGAVFGIKPCGLGARDTLRLEVCYPLNGNDLSATRTPLEAGLGFAVALEKGPFLGGEPLLAQKSGGTGLRLAAILLGEKTPPPRAHYPILHDGVIVGELTSGSLSPTLQRGIGLGYLPATLAAPGTALEIDVRGRKYPATVEKKPFVKNTSVRKS